MAQVFSCIKAEALLFVKVWAAPEIAAKIPR
jgi:hypothetical protein